jgi:hypothetical protein
VPSNSDCAGITIAYVNLGEQVYGLSVVDASTTFVDYALTADSLTSDTMLLNGQALSVNSTLDGLQRTGTPEIGAYSYGFVVLSGDVLKAC